MPAMPPPSPEFLEFVPHEFSRRHLVLSAGHESGQERLLIADSTRLDAAFNIGVRLGRSIVTEIRPAEEIAAAIDQAYLAARDDSSRQSEHPAIAVQASADIDADLNDAVREAERDLLATQGKTAAVRLVDLILFEAVQRGASDVHIQPLRRRTLVRYRLDGALRTARELPGGGGGGGGGEGISSSITSRIKVMANLDVAERRAPQDGRASVTIGGGGTGGNGGTGGTGGAAAGRRIDLRVSTLPSTYGERVVLRLLDPSRSPHLKSFAALGMPDVIRDKYLAQVSRTSGIVLSTGPTGSGKTTTLYATLAWISATNAAPPPPEPPTAPAASSPTFSAPHGGPANQQAASDHAPKGSLRAATLQSLSACELNIMTIEDPVEYDLAGALVGTGFVSAPGGASPSSASERGSLIVSQTQVDTKKNVTFATGLRHILRQDPDVIMVGEIRDQETARIAVQASLTGHLVLSTLHTSDAASAVARLLDLGIEPFLVASSLSAVLAQRLVRTLHPECRGGGCAACLGSGFKGRTGLFELLVLDPVIRGLIGERDSAAAIKHAARQAGMTTLREAGESLVGRGISTRAEVARVIDTFEEVET